MTSWRRSRPWKRDQSGSRPVKRLATSSPPRASMRNSAEVARPTIVRFWAASHDGAPIEHQATVSRRPHSRRQIAAPRADSSPIRTRGVDTNGNIPHADRPIRAAHDASEPEQPTPAAEYRRWCPQKTSRDAVIDTLFATRLTWRPKDKADPPYDIPSAIQRPVGPITAWFGIGQGPCAILDEGGRVVAADISEWGP